MDEILPCDRGIPQEKIVRSHANLLNYVYIRLAANSR